MSPEFDLTTFGRDVGIVVSALGMSQGRSDARDGALGAADRAVPGLKERYGYAPSFDSKSITDDPYEAMSHQEIFDKVGTLRPDDIPTAANNWRELGFEAAEATGNFVQQLGQQIGTRWQGPAASAAGEGVQRYAQSAIDLTFTSDELATKVVHSHHGVGTTKSTMPAPKSDSLFDSVVDVLSTPVRIVSGGSIKSRDHEREEAEEQARTIMRTQYAPVVRDAAVEVPVLPKAIDPLGGGATYQVPGSSGGSGSGGSGSGGWGSQGWDSQGSGGGGPAGPGSSLPQTNSPDALAARDVATESAAFAPGTGALQPNGGAPGAGTSPTPGTSPAANTSAAGAPGAPLGGTAVGPGVNSGPGSRFGGPGSRGTSGANGLGSGSGSAGTGSVAPRAGLPGGTLGPGGPLAGGSTTTAAGGTQSGLAGRPGAPGMGGMGMAPAAGRGAGGGDDDVHKTPSYLVDTVNGDELIGTLPLVAPPVLGA